jgi:hypothetical protein
MIQLRYTLELTDDINLISTKLKNVLAVEFTTRLRDAAKGIQNVVRQRVRKIIEESDTYHSLSYGRLRDEFGLTDAVSKVGTIVNIWVNSIRAEAKVIKFTGGRLNTGLVLQAIRGDYSDVFSAAEAIQITNKGTTLEWLQWLLTRGDTTIIREYDVAEVPGKRGRSGGLLTMQENKFARWSVPSEYAGTAHNNWITKIVDSIPLDYIVEQKIKRSLL